MKARLWTAAALLALGISGAFVLFPTALAPEPEGAGVGQSAAGSPTRLALVPAIARTAEAPPGAGGQQLAAPECRALAVPEGSSQLMQQEGRRRSERLLQRQGDAFAQALVADLAGHVAAVQPSVRPPFGLDQFRYARPMVVANRQLAAAEQRELAKLVAAEGVEGLIALGDASLFGAAIGRSTTTGHLIRRHAETDREALAAAASWLAIGLHELATAIEVGIPPNDFAVLLEAADVDPTASWPGGTNLARVAAIRNRPRILELLIARGIDPTVANAWERRSVLDDIAGRGWPAEAEEAALADVVRQLVAVGDRPYLPSTASALAKWLPQVRLPQLHPDAAALVPALADAADALAQLDVEWTGKVAAAKRIEVRCQALIRAPEVALRTFRATDLASKLRYQEALAARQEQVWQEALAARADSGRDQPRATMPPRLWDAIDDIYATGNADGWQRVLALADPLGARTNRRVLDYALGANAPLEVLLALARRADWQDGMAERPFGDWIFQLADSTRADIVAVVEALEPFGLDIHHVDAEGRNVFTSLAGRVEDDDRRWAIIEYLGSRSVSTKPSAYGLDPLDTVLMRLVDYPQTNLGATRFARFLRDHGAPVEESHLLLARQLADVDDDAYRHLVAAVPALSG